MKINKQESVDNRVQRLGPDVLKVQSGVRLLVNFPNHRPGKISATKQTHLLGLPNMSEMCVSKRTNKLYNDRHCTAEALCVKTTLGLDQSNWAQWVGRHSVLLLESCSGVRGHSHVVSSHYVESQHHLLDPLA